MHIFRTIGSTLICYSGQSMILTRHTQTNEISEIPAKLVLSNIHEVYSINDRAYIPVRYNVVTGPTTRFVKIKKDAIGDNQPSTDFYVTSGHKIVIDGIAIKAKNIKQGKRIKVKSQNVYSICTDKPSAILVNGLAVMTWGFDEFIIYAKQNNLLWNNNAN